MLGNLAFPDHSTPSFSSAGTVWYGFGRAPALTGGFILIQPYQSSGRGQEIESSVQLRSLLARMTTPCLVGSWNEGLVPPWLDFLATITLSSQALVVNLNQNEKSIGIDQRFESLTKQVGHNDAERVVYISKKHLNEECG